MNNQKTDKFFLEKILTDINFIVAHTQNIKPEELKSNEVLLDSMMFRLIQISESAKNLSLEFKQTHSNIPWIDISGLRNRLVHDYGNVDLTVIFVTITEDIPYLQEKINELLV